MLLYEFFRALDLAASKEVVRAEDRVKISVDFIVLQKPFELALQLAARRIERHAAAFDALHPVRGRGAL